MIYLATTAASLALALALAAAPQGGGERLVMQGPEPAVVRLGGSALVLLRVDTRKNPPAPKVPHVEGLRMQLVNRGTEESRSFVNGRQSFRRIRPSLLGASGSKQALRYAEIGKGLMPRTVH